MTRGTPQEDRRDDESWGPLLPPNFQDDVWAWIHYFRGMFSQLMQYPDRQSLPSELAGAPAYLRRMATRMMDRGPSIQYSPLLLLWIEAANMAFYAPKGGGVLMETITSMPGFSNIIFSMASGNLGSQATARLDDMIRQAVVVRQDRLLAIQSGLLASSEALLVKHWPALANAPEMRLPCTGGVFIVRAHADRLTFDFELPPEATGLLEPFILPAAVFRPEHPAGSRIELTPAFSGVKEFSLDMESFKFLIECVKTLTTQPKGKKKNRG